MTGLCMYMQGYRDCWVKARIWIKLEDRHCNVAIEVPRERPLHGCACVYTNYNCGTAAPEVQMQIWEDCITTTNKFEPAMSYMVTQAGSVITGVITIPIKA